MEKIGNYGIYRNNYYDRAQTQKTGTSAAAQTKEAEKAGQNKKTELSSDAKNLLKELKKKYGNMDFIVADYESDEEAASYLSRGTAQYSVLFTPDELEKMAADENVKNQNLKVLDDAVSKLGEMKDQLGEKGEDVSRLGIVIGDDGEVSYFAELEKVNEKQRERIEEKRESNREQKRDEVKEEAEKNFREKIEGPVKRTTVYASSVEELAEKIGQVDWSTVAEEDLPVGRHFNFFA